MPEQGNQSQETPDTDSSRPNSPGVADQGHTESQSSPWNPSAVFRFIGMGMALAGFTLFVAGIGYVIDSFSENPKPFGTAFGALIGFTLGMVRFIRQAKQSQD